jgi:broad specificity polyphosphatase/5'/3'-nucleotidase SurE
LGPIKFTSQGTSFYEDSFELYRQDGVQRYYRNVGSELRACELKADSDDRAVAEGNISLSLLRTDLTIPIPNAAARALEGHCNGLLRGARNHAGTAGH